MTLTFQLSAFFVGMYNKDNGSLSFIFGGDVPNLIMLNVYKIMVKDNEITPIENLPEEEKRLLVEECNATGLNFTNETLRNSARILSTIKQINEKS